jgi:hypothetical protein
MRALANLVSLNVVACVGAGSPADIHRVRAACKALFFGEGEFQARVDSVAAGCACDLLVGKSWTSFAAGSAR